MSKKDTYFIQIKGELYVRVYYRDVTGKWKTKSRKVPNKTEGRKILAELKAKVDAARPGEIEAEKLTFAQLLTSYPKPLPKWYKEPLESYFGATRVQTIDYAALKRFRDHRLTVPHKTTINKEEKRLRSVATINREMEVLRRLFVYAHKQGWITRNPFNQGDSLLPKAAEGHRDRLPTEDEINRLLEHATGQRAHLRPLIFAALDTGLRRGKLLSLTRAQLDFEQGLIDLGRPKVRTKKHPRFIGMTARLKSELLAWLETRDEGEQLVFHAGDFKRAWATLCRLAKVTDLHFHDLRHWHATQLILKGIPKDLAMKQFGHTESATFDRYFNVDAEMARMIARALDG